MQGLLGGFLSPEAGQARRAWLNEQDQRIDGVLSYFLGPQLMPRVRGAVGAANELTDFADYRDAVLGADQMATGSTTADRIAGAGTMATGLAAVMVPGVSARMAEGATDVAGDLARFIADEDGGIRVWHGSPHDFDKFSMDAIGTGEGAQAYGHGLYFAESDKVAKEYRDALSATHRDTFRDPPLFDALGRVPSRFISADLQRAIARNGPGEAKQRLKEIKAETSALREQMAAEPELASVIEGMLASYDGEVSELNEIVLKGHANNYPFGGRLYEVDLHANPEDFLDWDAPLSGGELWDIGDGLSGSMDRAEEELSDFFRYSALPGDMTGREAYMWLGNTFGKDEMPDGVFSLPEREGAQYAAQALKNAGFPGIRYLDAGSRGAGDGTRNYVVFDENIIEIVKKYGIAGAAAMLGLSAADVEAQVAQQGSGGGW